MLECACGALEESYASVLIVTKYTMTNFSYLNLLSIRTERKKSCLCALWSGEESYCIVVDEQAVYCRLSRGFLTLFKMNPSYMKIRIGF